MSPLNLQDDPHHRFNPLKGEWIQVSPHRTDRPWQGSEESRPREEKKKYDPDCYLCPGNARAEGRRNPDYKGTHVFTNDFSALNLSTPEVMLEKEDLLKAKGERGICRVICFSPRHDLTLPELEKTQLQQVVERWIEEFNELGSREEINYVLVFENKGEIMGCSNPHPHGQIYAYGSVPREPAREAIQFRKYYSEHGRTLLQDYLKLELKLDERIVLQDEAFVALVPFWAYWPFETMIMSRRPFARFSDMRNDEIVSLTSILHRLTAVYDNLFEISFPYSAGFHPAPTDGKGHPEWHFHMHFYPPLLRSPVIKKFRVGSEMLGIPQRDFTPEYAAEKLRRLPEVHYKKR